MTTDIVTSLHPMYRIYASILYRFRDIASYLSKIADFNLLHLHLALQLGVTPFEFHQHLWQQRRSLRDPIFSRFYTIPACADRQTQAHRIYCTSIASCGKNWLRDHDHKNGPF